MKVQEYIEQQNASTNVLGKMKIQIFYWNEQYYNATTNVFLVRVCSCLFMSIDDLSHHLLLKDVCPNSQVDGPFFISLKSKSMFESPFNILRLT
jgi:hypothetical protein